MESLLLDDVFNSSVFYRIINHRCLIVTALHSNLWPNQKTKEIKVFIFPLSLFRNSVQSFNKMGTVGIISSELDSNSSIYFSQC